MKQNKEYWQKRCELAEKVINASDTGRSWATVKWQGFINHKSSLPWFDAPVPPPKRVTVVSLPSQVQKETFDYMARGQTNNFNDAGTSTPLPSNMPRSNSNEGIVYKTKPPKTGIFNWLNENFNLLKKVE